MARAKIDSSTIKAATQKANSKTTKDVKGKKRAPSAYNLYMAEHLKKWKEDNPGKPIKEGMADVAAMWRNAPENPKAGQETAPKKAPKPKATKKKEEVVEDDDEGSE